MLASLNVLGTHSKAATKPRFRMGLQLYTVRDPMAKDAAGTLRQIAALGYRNLETYGFEYITWAWLDPQSRGLDSFRLVARRLNLIGEQAARAGLNVAYHNHDFEFTSHDGETGYDIIMRETDPALVKLQLDLFWVAHSSARSPHELFALQPGRFVMWHVKDMDAQKRYTELGNGTIDFTRIMPDARLAGLEEYFVEQGDNFAVTPMKSIETSAGYVKQHLE